MWLHFGELVARVVAGALFNAFWLGLALAGIAWLAIKAYPRAATRHAIWLVALLAVIALPALTGHALVSFESQPQAHASVLNPQQGTGALPNVLSAFDPFRLHVPERWARLFFLLWYVVATALIARLCWGYVRLQQLKAGAAQLGPPYQARMRGWLAALGGDRPARVCASDQVIVPAAVGLWDPIIVIPQRLVDRLSDLELDQIGLHELAHLQRRDDLADVLQKIAQALFFFHPAVHWVSRQLSLEREIACDDRVVAATGRPVNYAACLTRLAEATSCRFEVLHALGVFESRRQVAIRIERLLDRDFAKTFRVSKFGGAVGAAVVAAALGCAAFVAPIVSVTQDPPAVTGRVSVSIVPVQLQRGSHVLGVVAVRARRVKEQHVAAAGASCPTPRRADPHPRPSTKHTVVATRHPARLNRPQPARVAPPKPADVAQKRIAIAIVAAPQASVMLPNDVADVIGDISIPIVVADLNPPPLATDAAVQPESDETLIQALRSAHGSATRLRLVERLATRADHPAVRSELARVMAEDHSTAVRLRAVWALAPYAKERDVRSAFVKALDTARSTAVRLAVVDALEPQAADPGVRDALITALRTSPSRAVRAQITGVLRKYDSDPVVHKALADAAVEWMPRVAIGADALSRPEVREALDRLSKCSCGPQIRDAINEALKRCGLPTPTP